MNNHCVREDNDPDDPQKIVVPLLLSCLGVIDVKKNLGNRDSF